MGKVTQILRDNLEQKNLIAHKIACAYDTAFESVPGLSVTADRHGYFVEVNHQWEKILGWSKKELTSTPFIDFVHPDDRAATLQVYEDQIMRGKTAIEFSNRYRHKQGHYIRMEWYSSRPDRNGFIHAIAHPHKL